MASGEARRVGGRGRFLPCGCSDGPAASLQAASRPSARTRAPASRTSIGSFSAKLCGGGGTSRTEISAGSGPPPRDHRAERARAVRAEERAGELERSIDILRWRLERRVEVLKEENEDLRERAVLAEVRVDELEEDLDRARGAR